MCFIEYFGSKGGLFLEPGLVVFKEFHCDFIYHSRNPFTHLTTHAQLGATVGHLVESKEVCEYQETNIGYFVR